MVSFTCLPNEILLQFLTHLEPPDYCSFYGIDHNIHALTGIHRLRYQSLRSEFSKPTNTSEPGLTATLIAKIASLPQAREYVQHWTIDGCMEEWHLSESDGYGQRHIPYPDPVMNTLENLFREAMHLGQIDKQHVITNMRCGAEAGLIVLALTLLPNLTSLDLQHSSSVFGNMSHLARVIRRWDSSAPPPSLALKRVNLSKGIFCVTTTFIRDLATLPSIRVINADKIVDDNYRLQAQASRLWYSNITDLNLSRADLTPERLMQLLEGLNSLDSFAYWPASDQVRLHKFQPFSIISCLLACSKTSLRRLYIRAGEVTPQYMGSLKQFATLEYLETDLEMLVGRIVGRHSETPAQLESSLPPSIQWIRFFGRPALFANERCKTLLDGLPALKKICRKLNSVELAGFEIAEASSRDLLEACRYEMFSLKVNNSGPTLCPVFDRYVSRHQRTRYR